MSTKDRVLSFSLFIGMVTTAVFFRRRRSRKLKGEEEHHQNQNTTEYCSHISPVIIETFRRQGVVVIPGVLSAEEVAEARAGMRQSLSNIGV